ncbi:MAG: nucleotide exchange factor GrpE [Candidatus Latescibacteria bacterium]|jgi:molecular chaperone GrpE|nr:nucleotide exchange factor GrpE [Candidatus Latescibacterota bacterium]
MADKKRKSHHTKEAEEKITTEDSGQKKEIVELQDEAETRKEQAATDGVDTKKQEIKETTDVTEEEPEAPSAEERFTALNDRYLRLLAEYDNYRKRTEREKIELISTASENLMIGLLPVLDNLDRATEHKNDKASFEEYVKGIAIIEDQFRAALSKDGLETIEAVGKPFDPVIHEAVTQIETDEFESGIVSAEVEKGYMLFGKVIRHPKVIVSK